MSRLPRVAAPVTAAALVLAGLAACSSDAAEPGSAGAAGSSSPAATGAVSTGSVATGTSPGSTAGPSTSTSAPSTTAAATVQVDGVPAEVVTLVQALYGGKDVSAQANASTIAALSGRTAPTGLTTAQGTIGAWHTKPVSVVTMDKDVTLLSADNGTWTIVGGWWPSMGKGTPSLGAAGPRWVLAIGSDARPGEDIQRSRADTLQVVGMDGQGGGGVMGMARDLWVPLSTGGENKINSAMVYGGPMAQLQTVRNVTGLPVEGYLIIDFEGVRKTINDLGGLYMEIPKAVQANSIEIPAGNYALNGSQVLAYARERKSLPDGDFGRSAHQSQILLAAAVQAKLKGPLGIPEYMTALSKTVNSNMTAEMMMTYAGRVYAANPMKIGTAVAKGPFGWAGKASIVVLGSEARGIFADFKDGNLG